MDIYSHPSTAELELVTAVSQDHGIPIRRASELYHNSPDASTSFDVYKIMRREVEATLGGVATYCLAQFEERGINPILEAHNREIQVYPKIDVFDSVWTGIPKVDTRIETPYVDAHDFLRVTATDSTHKTLEIVKNTYEAGSIPIAMHDAVLRTSELLDMAPPEAMNFLMKFIAKSFAHLGTYAADTPAGLEKSRTAFRGMISDYDTVLQAIRTSMNNGTPLANASRSILREFYSRPTASETTALVLDEREVLGIRDICKIQRRPFTDTELTLAQSLVDDNKPFVDAVTAFHYLLTDYSRNYLTEHPERMRYTFRDFNTLLLVYRDQDEITHVSPNPDMLSSFSDNWFGAIAKEVLRRQQGGEADGTPDIRLTPDDIVAGILRSQKLSAFRMRIGMFNTSDEGEIQWNGNMLRVCPAEKIATDAGVETVPKLYAALHNAKELRGIGVYVAPGELRTANEVLADALLAQLQSTDTVLFITGEAATGKSRVTQELSQLMDLPVIDVGLGYRLAAYLKGGPSQVQTAELLTTMSQGFGVRTVNGECRIFDNIGQDITNLLRDSVMDQRSSSIGPDDDESILEFLRSQIDGPFLVAARNTALAAPDASTIQINLSCELAERARRRATQMGRNDVQAVYEELLARERKSARHYTSGSDVITLDTTRLNAEGVTTELMKMAYARITK